MACVPSTVGFQPEIVPVRVSKRNRLGPETPFTETGKAPEELKILKTVPVGKETGLLALDGMVTTSGIGCP
jgi:hypothetical protein